MISIVRAYDRAVYEASLAVHVVAAIVGFGATFTYPVIQLVAERREPGALAFAMSTILAISRWVAVPATTIVGITGVYQVAAGPYSLGEAWLAAGAALYAFVMVVGVFVLAPAYGRAQRAAAQFAASELIEVPREYRAALRRPALLGPLVAAAIVATAVLMEVKPG
jgi:uncharacterized membrane protein